jgi:hypothetical protein
MSDLTEGEWRDSLLEVQRIAEAGIQAYNDALNYALDECGPEAVTFLRLWREGDWAAIEREFPGYNVPAILRGG